MKKLDVSDDNNIFGDRAKEYESVLNEMSNLDQQNRAKTERFRRNMERYRKAYNKKGIIGKLGSNVASLLGFGDKSKLLRAEEKYWQAKNRTDDNARKYNKLLDQVNSLNKKAHEFNKNLESEAEEHGGLFGGKAWQWIGDKVGLGDFFRNMKAVSQEDWKNQQRKEFWDENEIRNIEELRDSLKSNKVNSGSGFRFRLFGNRFSRTPSRSVKYLPSFNFSRSKYSEEQMDQIRFARRHAARMRAGNSNFSLATFIFGPKQRKLIEDGRVRVSRNDIEYLNNKAWYQRGQSQGPVPSGIVIKDSEGRTLPSDAVTPTYGLSVQGREMSRTLNPAFRSLGSIISTDLGGDAQSGSMLGQFLGDRLANQLGTSLASMTPGAAVATMGPEQFYAEMKRRYKRGMDIKLPNNREDLEYANLKAKYKYGGYGADIMSGVLPGVISQIGDIAARKYQASRMEDAQRKLNPGGVIKVDSGPGFLSVIPGAIMQVGQSLLNTHKDRMAYENWRRYRRANKQAY